MVETNPLLRASTYPHGAVPFHEIKVEHYIPAAKIAYEEARRNVKAIADKIEPPNFNNTIFALETCAERAEYVQGVYWILFSAESNEAHQALAGELSAMQAAFASDLFLNEKLFLRVKTLYDKRTSLSLGQEESEMLKKCYRQFRRNGALLNGKDKEKLREIDKELAALGPKFSENLLRATNAFEYLVTDKNELSGLPEAALEAAHEAAKARGKEGWLLTLQEPSLIPVMKYADHAKLRETLVRAYRSRSYKDAYDNQEILKSLVKLRHERANLLGYETHAHYVLEERMAETPAKVRVFLDDLFKNSLPAAKKEFQEIKEFKRDLTGEDQFYAWDYSYYFEKLKKKRFDVDEEELRPYFELSKVIEGVFRHAELLYGLKFKEANGIPLYHKDVKTYEVVDENGNFIGLFYADFFPRVTKRSGAWMNPILEQGYFMGEKRRPHISIVCNFTPPTASKPSLLSMSEVRTLFHEFGHALHGLLSDCHYRSLAGTNVYWDFVELPSQIMENWLNEQEALNLFSVHYKTGEKIPSTLVDKVKKSKTFHAGMASLRQLSFAYLDFAWHAQDPTHIEDVSAFENEVLKPLQLLPAIEGTNSSCSFAHIFSGGYSAGYYSYKWAEVLDADAFEYFKEKGIFNREVAKSFRDNVLSKGATEHPMTLYKRFRGREPDPKALLRRDGLI